MARTGSRRRCQELQAYFGRAVPGQTVQAIPGDGLEVPIWLLGSSLFSAQLAAALGLPYAFASHFAPDDLHEALDLYRGRFTPSARFDRPYVMVGANVVAADTDAEARRLFTSLQQSFVNLRRGAFGQVPPPIDDIDSYWSPTEKAGVEHALRYSFVGSPPTVERGPAGVPGGDAARRTDRHRARARPGRAPAIAGGGRRGQGSSRRPVRVVTAPCRSRSAVWRSGRTETIVRSASGEPGRHKIGGDNHEQKRRDVWDGQCRRKRRV